MFVLLKPIKQFYLIIAFSILCVKNASAQNVDVFEAARKGDTLTLIKLKALSKDTLSSVNAAGFTPLIIACYRGQTETVRFLVTKGVDLNTASPEGNALMAAVFHKNLEIMEILLQHHVQTDARDASGATALIMATKMLFPEVVKLLLTYKANKNLKDNFGKTALDYAILYKSAEIEKLLSN